METRVKTIPYGGQFSNAMFRSTGWGCGYVDLPPDHMSHGVDYHDLFIPEAEELTYSGLTDDGWWRVGFDTAHSYNGPEHDEAWVQAEAEKLKAFFDAQKPVRKYILSHSHEYGVSLWAFQTADRVPSGTYNCENIEEYPEAAEAIGKITGALGAEIDFSSCTEEVHIGEVSEFPTINI